MLGELRFAGAWRALSGARARRVRSRPGSGAPQHASGRAAGIGQDPAGVRDPAPDRRAGARARAELGDPGPVGAGRRGVRRVRGAGRGGAPAPPSPCPHSTRRSRGSRTRAPRCAARRRRAGYLRCLLRAATPEEAAHVTAGLDALLGPVERPRYLVSRLIAPPDPSALTALRLAAGGHGPLVEAWHAVPDDLGRRKHRAEAFAGGVAPLARAGGAGLHAARRAGTGGARRRGRAGLELRHATARGVAVVRRSRSPRRGRRRRRRGRR